MKSLVIFLFFICFFKQAKSSSLSKEVRDAFGPGPQKAHEEERSRVEKKIKKYFNEKYHQALNLIYASAPDEQTREKNLRRAFRILKDSDLQRFNIDALIDYSILLYQFKLKSRQNLINKISKSRSYYYNKSFISNKKFKGLPFSAEDFYAENSDLFDDKINNLRRVVLYPYSKKDYVGLKVLEPGVPSENSEGVKFSKTMQKDIEFEEPYGVYQKEYYQQTIYKIKQKMLEAFINFSYAANTKKTLYKPRLNYHLGMMYLRGDAFLLHDSGIRKLEEKHGGEDLLEEEFKKGNYFGTKHNERSGRAKPVLFKQFDGTPQVYSPDYINLEKAFLTLYQAVQNYQEIRQKDLEARQEEGLKLEDLPGSAYKEYFPAVYEAALMLIEKKGLPDKETLKSLGLGQVSKQDDFRGEGFRILHLLSKDGSRKAANLTAEYYIHGKAYEQAKKYLQFALKSKDSEQKGKTFYLFGKIHEETFKETKDKAELKEAYELYSKALRKGSHLGYLGLGRMATFYPEHFFDFELERQFELKKQTFSDPEIRKSYLRRNGQKMPQFDELSEEEKQKLFDETKQKLNKKGIKSIRNYYLKQTIIHHSEADNNFVESSKAKLEASYLLSVIYQNGKLDNQKNSFKAFHIYRPYVIDLIREIKAEYLNTNEADFLRAAKRIKKYASKIKSDMHIKMLFEFCVMILRNQITRQQLADLSGNDMWTKEIKEKSAIRILQILHEKGYKPASYLYGLTRYAYTEVFFNHFDKYTQAIKYFESAGNYAPALSRLGEMYYLGPQIRISKYDQIDFLKKNPKLPIYLIPEDQKALDYVQKSIEVGEKNLKKLQQDPLSDFEENLLKESIYRSKHYLALLQIKHTSLFEKKEEDQKRVKENGMKLLKSLAEKNYSPSQYELVNIIYSTENIEFIKDEFSIDSEKAKQVYPLLIKLSQKTPISDRRDIRDLLHFSRFERVSYIHWRKSKYFLARMFYEGVEGVVEKNHELAFRLYQDLILPPRNIDYLNLNEQLVFFRDKIKNSEDRKLYKEARKKQIEADRANLRRLTEIRNLVHETMLSERSKARVGMMYAEGLGVEKDLIKAYAYIHASYFQYNDYTLIPQEVEEVYHNLDRRLTNAQKREALSFIDNRGLFYNPSLFDQFITNSMKQDFWGTEDNKIDQRLRNRVFRQNPVKKIAKKAKVK